MTSKMLYMFLDAMTCALGGVLVILFAELNQSSDLIANLQDTLAKHHAEMQMVAKLHEDRDAAVRKAIRQESDIFDYRRMLSGSQSREAVAVKNSVVLREDLANAVAVNKQQAADIKQSNKARNLLNTQLRIAQEKQSELARGKQRRVHRGRSARSGRRHVSARRPPRGAIARAPTSAVPDVT